MCASYSASSRSRLLLLLLLLLQLEVFSARRKEMVVPSTPSAPRSDGTTRRGASPAECRTVRSLRCGPATSDRGAGRSPGGGVFCPRRAQCGSCSTSSSALVTSFWLRGAPFTRCAPCRTSGASPLPGPQRPTAARVATTSAVVAACDAEQLPSRAAS